MRILLINDDHYHPGTVSAEGVKPLQQQGFEFDVLGDGAAFSGVDLQKYPVVLFVKSDNRTASDQTKWATGEVRQALAAHVEGGGGLLAVHSGTAGYTGSEDMLALLGGLFMVHPEQLPVTFNPKAGHPVTQGVHAFTERDEHYFMNMAEGPVSR